MNDEHLREQARKMGKGVKGFLFVPSGEAVWYRVDSLNRVRRIPDEHTSDAKTSSASRLLPPHLKKQPQMRHPAYAREER